MMTRCALIAGFALFAAVANLLNSLDDCFRQERSAGQDRTATFHDQSARVQT